MCIRDRYQPAGANQERLLVYFHGGGWCVGSVATHDNIVRRLAVGLGCEAWSLEYSLAPESPWPEGLLDCTAAVRLAATERPQAQIIVGGDSAGATAVRARRGHTPRRPAADPADRRRARHPARSVACARRQAAARQAAGGAR